jgi:hypothetical protein
LLLYLRRAVILRVALQVRAAGELDVLEFLDGDEGAVDQDRVRQWPQVLGGLQFGRIGREKQQVDVVGYAQVDTGVPSRPIQYEDDLLVGLAPTARAKAASSTSKSGIQTPVARWKTVRPGQIEAGWTKPTR